MGGWVWTTFNDYQWDLDHSNPAVFRAMLATMLGLANRGVDVLRLDAVPFLWKRLGTDCQNQPEAHLLVQAFRALTRVAVPGLLFKAEAIVAPEMLVQYLGAHDRYRPECDLAYNNQLMVLLWSSLAARDARLAATALARLRPAPARTGWVTYLRCHDDIGWAVSDVDAAAARHRAASRTGCSWPGTTPASSPARSPAARSSSRPRGARRGRPGWRRRCAASRRRWTAGRRRASWTRRSGGWRRSTRWSSPSAGSRCCGWATSWRCATTVTGRPRRRTPATTGGCTGRGWTGRRPSGGTPRTRSKDASSVWSGGWSTPAGRSSRCGPAARPTVYFPDDPHVLAYRRRHERSAPLLALANFSDGWQSVDLGLVAAAGIGAPAHVHSTRGRLDVGEGRLHLPPWGFSWLTNE